MLAIRMQRVGRRGHAQFRVIVQDSRWSPKSGKFVALLGSYDPHTKTTTLVKEKAQTFLNNGAQPSSRVASLFKQEGIKLPKWVSQETKKTGQTKNPEKLRKNQPAEAAAKPAEESAETEAQAEAPADVPESEATTETVSAEPAETPAGEETAEPVDEASK